MSKKLIQPDEKIVDLFNSFWDEPKETKIKLFEDGETINIENYIKGFKDYKAKDDEIKNEKDITKFFEKISVQYSTRVKGGISTIIEMLKEKVINSKDDLACKIKEKKEKEKFSFNEFMGICKKATGQYTYSFATKVFSFIDEEKYPIMDSIVVTLLDKYLSDEDFEGECKENKDKIHKKNKWGDYSKYKESYEVFKKHYKLDCSLKEIDMFLWTYGKILEKYWEDMGVIRFESISFDPESLKSLKGNE